MGFAPSANAYGGLYWNGPRVIRTVVNGVPIAYGYHPFTGQRWVTRIGYGVPYGYSYYRYRNFLPRFATYGVISYSPSTKTGGVSWGEPNLSDSTDKANRYCAQADCKAAVWVRGGCAAIAGSDENTKFITWAYHYTKSQAIRAAIRSCNGLSGSQCHSIAWVCSFN